MDEEKLDIQPEEAESFAFKVVVHDAQLDRHTIRCHDKGEVLNWCAKFVDDLETSGTAGINIAIYNLTD